MVRFNASALLAGLGARLAALRATGTFSPPPAEALSEAGGDVPRLLLSPSVQRSVLPGGTIIQDWQPYQPRKSNLRLLAAKGLEWRVDSRACSRGARAPSPSHMAETALGAASTLTPSAATARKCRASFCGTCSARPRTSQASTLCASSSWRRSCWSQLADFCQAGLGLELVKGYTEQCLLEADI